MKKLLTASLPALALLALGGCAATRPVATTEDDGVYYSSKDHTTAVVQRAPAAASADNTPVPTEEATNPDYQAGTQRQADTNSEYYDDSYASSSYYDNSAFRRPYAGPTVGLAYYSPPVVFAPPISYGYSDFGYGYSPYGSVFCDPFYSPYYASPLYGPSAFYSPFGYGGYGGAYISIGVGFGRPWGGYGYGYGRPYYSGYSAYGYDPYYGGGGYYGRGYTNYGGYYGGRQVVRAYGNNAGVGNPVLVGPRRGRGGDVLAGRGNAAATPGTVPAPTTPTGGRRNMDGVVASPGAPVDGLNAPNNPGAANATTGRRRNMDSNVSSPAPIGSQDQLNGGGRLNNGGMADRPGRSETASPALNEGTRPARGRWRNLDEGAANGSAAGNAPNTNRGYEQPQQPDAQPQATDRPSRRARIFENTTPPNLGQGQANSGYEQRPAPQPQPQRVYEQPAPQPQPQRTYERPQRTYEQPAYSQPQPQRSYERPSYSAPSSQPSGGSSGGGGGGRRGGRW